MESSLKFFNKKTASFGRHETFALRYSWLTKGFQAFHSDKAVFSSDKSTIELGVGKNMVNAIKYWLRATTMLTDDPVEGLKATSIGKAIFSEGGWDPYLEDEATLWLLHWLLATNCELASAWYWFFNRFHKAEFTGEEAAEALADFVRNNLSGKHSEKTVKHEIAMILRMYCPPKANSNAPLEDSLDAPLSSLKLVMAAEGSRLYRSYANAQPNLPISVIGYAVTEVFNQRRAEAMPINDLMYGQNNNVALGRMFRLTESALLAKLENLAQAYPAIFQINETAGINQLYRSDNSVASLDFLHHYYQAV
ncbi:DUF4007 family protein [Methylobacter sp.]|uniref:DUF4007 family protein n=1 Tax=Methylobacter sp. TaxID=2051955 RepID=UPI002488B527|nr:DUF4007 family protein [Methylobacter sp.]MDI1277461.1 DUF4007 family protein [Methylobacter sp.]MDI1358080.1 DUF4007 family protein [Methylobacter sp.]